MITPRAMFDEATARGFGLVTTVPCSYLTPFMNYASTSGSIRYIGAANEGDAVAIGCGVRLGGGRAMVGLQNSGLGNAVNPLTSLAWPFRLPVLLVVSLRGDPEGPADEPQHRLMGSVTTRLLELMEIPWQRLADDDAALAGIFDWVDRTMSAGTTCALVVPKGTFAAFAAEAPAEMGSPPAPAPASRGAGPTYGLARMEALQAVVETTSAEHDVVVATTGYTGRELYGVEDRPNHLYMVGSMGCASSLGLGLAATRPDRRVVVLDGDGAALMRLGALPVIGHEAPANLVHVLLDNGVHESTGGQPTVSRGVDWLGIGHAAGYREVHRCESADALRAVLSRREPGPWFVHVPVSRSRGAAPRPSLTPAEAAQRLAEHLREGTP